MTTITKVSKRTYSHDSENVRVIISKYANPENTAVILETPDGYYYTDVSTNINPLPLNRFAVDINNNPDIGTWLQENNIAHYTGTEIKSGFISYPVYEFNDDFNDELEYDD